MSLTNEGNEKEQKKQISIEKQSIFQMLILLGLSFVCIFIILLVVFIIIRSIPGNPYMIRIGEHPTTAQLEYLQSLEEMWGLNEPIIVQFFMFYRNIFSGNCGDPNVVALNSDVINSLCGIWTRIVSLGLFLAIISSAVIVNFRKYNITSETISEPTIDNPQFTIGSNYKSKRYIDKEIFRKIKPKIFIQLIILGISFILVILILILVIYV